MRLVFCVTLPLMRTERISSSLVTLVNVSGITWVFHGLLNLTRLLMRWLLLLGGILVSHFSQRWSSLLLGIFGHKEMGRFSEMSYLLSDPGGEIFFMTFLF